MVENLRGWLELLALGLSPLIAVQVSEWLRKRQERRARKEWVLWTLLATRHSIFADDRLRAINSVEFYYHKESSVRRLFQEYMQMLGNEGLDNAQGYVERDRKLTELVNEMARTLGYGQTFNALDFQRGYIPRYFNTIAEQNRRSQELVEAGIGFFTQVQTTLASSSNSSPPTST